MPLLYATFDFIEYLFELPNLVGLYYILMATLKTSPKIKPLLFRWRCNLNNFILNMHRLESVSRLSLI